MTSCSSEDARAFEAARRFLEDEPDDLSLDMVRQVVRGIYDAAEHLQTEVATRLDLHGRLSLSVQPLLDERVRLRKQVAELRAVPSEMADRIEVERCDDCPFHRRRSVRHAGARDYCKHRRRPFDNAIPVGNPPPNWCPLRSRAPMVSLRE